MPLSRTQEPPAVHPQRPARECRHEFARTSPSTDRREHPCDTGARRLSGRHPVGIRPRFRGAVTHSVERGAIPPDASADPSAAAGPDAPDAEILQVVADELRVRAEAGTEAELVGTLARGAPVRVESGPVERAGFTWYEVTDLAGRRGWAADGDGVDPWLSSIPDLSAARPLLALEHACDIVGPINPPVTVLDDGHVLMTRGTAGEWRIARLSENGLQTIREDVLGSPYLQASAEYRPQRRPDAGEPPGHGACLYTFTIPTQGQPIVVSLTGWFGDAEEAQFYAPSPERKALTGIATNLIAIDEVLGDEAWAAPALPYIANEFMISIAPEMDPESLGLGDVEWSGDPADTGGCAIISRAQAFAAARALNEDGASDLIRLDGIYGITFPSLVLAPRTPAGYPECEESGN